MSARSVKRVLEQLRCIECHRSPTDEEVVEMYAVFGHKITPADAPSLVWECLGCQHPITVPTFRAGDGRPS